MCVTLDVTSGAEPVAAKLGDAIGEGEIAVCGRRGQSCSRNARGAEFGNVVEHDVRPVGQRNGTQKTVLSW